MFNKILHQPIRSKLMATLINNENISFKGLKEELKLTDGNLSSHLRKLEESNYVKIEKSFEGKKTKTIIYISKNGYKEFKLYIEDLKKFINNL